MHKLIKSNAKLSSRDIDELKIEPNQEKSFENILEFSHCIN